MGLLYARAMGGRVAVASSTREKEGDARTLGAELFIHAKSQDVAATLTHWEGGTVARRAAGRRERIDA
jgi:D-arabinose 1-dehydrogenase-like Zn-dependent alcohol dehydrogenase